MFWLAVDQLSSSLSAYQRREVCYLIFAVLNACLMASSSIFIALISRACTLNPVAYDAIADWSLSSSPRLASGGISRSPFEIHLLDSSLISSFDENELALFRCFGELVRPFPEPSGFLSQPSYAIKHRREDSIAQ